MRAACWKVNRRRVKRAKFGGSGEVILDALGLDGAR